MTELQNKLFALADSEYKAFHSRLMPTVNPELVIGVRTPVLRGFAKEFAKTPESREFLNQLPHKYYEENNLHGMIIEQIKDYDTALCETKRFLPYIDNWATCDMFMPKVFRKNTDKLISEAIEWINSESTYTVRYGIGVLLKLYLDSEFKPEYIKAVSEVKSDEYYINMMIAWYFATALAKQYDAAIVYITENRLDTWVHNKAIQTAVESNRISAETKSYLKTLGRRCNIRTRSKR